MACISQSILALKLQSWGQLPMQRLTKWSSTSCTKIFVFHFRLIAPRYRSPGFWMVWDTMSSMLVVVVGLLCFIESKANTAFPRRCVNTSCLYLLTSFMDMLLPFSNMTQHLPTAQKHHYCVWLAWPGTPAVQQCDRLPATPHVLKFLANKSQPSNEFVNMV